MKDWKENLKTIAEELRLQQKNKKKARSKFDDQENFRGRKGFNDTGIAITEKTIKQQRKNKSNYNKTRYEGSRLQLINDARAAAAQQRRLDNPQLKKRVDAINEVADERVAEKERRQNYQIKLDNMRSRDPGGSINVGTRNYIYYDGTPADDGSVEINHSDWEAATRSVINQEPVFRNKIEENIWRLKNKK